VLIVFALFLARTFLADFAVVQGRSMLPSLRSGDIVFILKAAYGLRNPFGGYFFLWGDPRDRDIVAASRPDTGKAVIKRVRVEGEIIANAEGRERGEASYYLLGDNKYESIDSREFGPVPMNNILGRVFFLPRF
jgi:signal peptidase I